MYKKIGSWLGVIAVACTILGFVLTQILDKTLAQVLTMTVYLPLWTIVLLVIFIVILFGILFKKSPVEIDLPNLVFHEQPRKVTSQHKESATPASSKILRSPTGSIATWVYLQPFGEGIRRLINNRYIVAHDSNGGVKKQIGDQSEYVNVFSLSRGPKSWSPPDNPVWKLWLTNGKGERKIWVFADFAELKPGWHHFLIRWDHGSPLLELLIDSKTVIQCDDYRKYWPEEFANQILFGTWAQRWSEHFIETWLWRTILSLNFLDEAWLVGELAKVHPQLP